ncbi:ribonuclease HII [Salegentibacter sp. HM20]
MLKQFDNKIIIAGTDEAGRGCLAGPVTAAAVVLPRNFKNDLLNDSKQTSLTARNLLRGIIEKECASFGVAQVWNGEIDQINILNASILAMHRALEKLDCDYKHIIVDGNRFKDFKNISHSCIIKGDAKFLSIAAASILAKTYRDACMEQLHEEFPMYNWKKNKGYPTKEHRAALEKYGPTKYHRQSFKLLPEQLSLEF